MFGYWKPSESLRRLLASKTDFVKFVILAFRFAVFLRIGIAEFLYIHICANAVFVHKNACLIDMLYVTLHTETKNSNDTTQKGYTDEWAN